MKILTKISCSGYISLQILLIALHLPNGNMSPVDPTTLYLHRNIFDQQLSGITDPEIVKDLKGLWVDDEPRMTEDLEHRGEYFATDYETFP